MRDRIRTLVLYANGAKWQAALLETTLRGLLGFEPETVLPPRLLHHPLVRKLIGQRYEAASYINDWQEAFCQAPELDVRLCNISNLIEYSQHRRLIAEYPLVVILHSAAGDDMQILLKTADWFKRRRGRLLIFLGNEYDLMDEKIGFIQSVEADYVGTQLPMDAARWLYAECDRSQILAAPHALNPKVYTPDPNSARTIDIGFIGDFYPYFIGDIERARMIQFFQTHAAEWGLTCQVRKQRVHRAEWARFLNSCHGIVGGESGTYYLERNGKTISAVKAYLKAHPAAPFEEVFERFFKNYPNPVSGKAISSRHFEPVGTKTCQILLEGNYNGILLADEHYISVKKDLSNIDDAICRFKDEAYRQAMVDRTFEYVLDQHTYRHRVESIIKTIVASSPRTHSAALQPRVHRAAVRNALHLSTQAPATHNSARFDDQGVIWRR